MPFCSKCGTQIPEGSKFCPSCGASSAASAQQASANNGAVGQVMNTADTTAEYDPRDISDNKVMGVLAYFGILFLIPLLAAPNSRFARFHANQGLILFILEIAYGIVQAILSALFFAISWRFGYAMATILGLLWIVLGVFAIIGIVNAAQGKAKELPIIGKFKIIK